MSRNCQLYIVHIEQTPPSILTRLDQLERVNFSCDSFSLATITSARAAHAFACLLRLASNIEIKYNDMLISITAQQKLDRTKYMVGGDTDNVLRLFLSRGRRVIGRALR